MPSDLESSLIDGGISPAAAKILSNAIGNAASGKTYTGRQTEDATPQSMRMIDRNARRYVLTNLDHGSDERFRQRLVRAGVQFTPHASPHPYSGSQPSSANPTLSTPTVSPGKFISSTQKTTNDVAQSEVGLNVEDLGGEYPRLNKATGMVESVPFLVEIEPKGLFEGQVVQENGKTILRLTLTNDTLRRLASLKLQAITGLDVTVHGTKHGGTLYADNLGWGGRGLYVLGPQTY